MKKLYGHSRRMTVPAIVTSVLLMLFSSSCASGDKVQPKFPPNEEIKTLVVVPLKNQSLLRGEGETYRCTLCGGMFTTSRVEKGAEVFVTDNIVGALSARRTITLLSNDRVNTIRRQLLLDDESTPSDLALLIEIGRELGADAVLTGSVYKFIQRIGSDFAADTPASVGLDLDLIDVNNSQLIWHARFDETQEYLTNNFMKIFTFFKRGGKWITAEKLAASGIKKMLEGSPIP